jgi:hypothetical protein
MSRLCFAPLTRGEATPDPVGGSGGLVFTIAEPPVRLRLTTPLSGGQGQ